MTRPLPTTGAPGTTVGERCRTIWGLGPTTMDQGVATGINLGPTTMDQGAVTLIKAAPEGRVDLVLVLESALFALSGRYRIWHPLEILIIILIVFVHLTIQ